MNNNLSVKFSLFFISEKEEKFVSFIKNDYRLQPI